MSDVFHCRCNASRLVATGIPLLRAYCHCSSCRSFHGGPMFAATVWRSADVSAATGANFIKQYPHPTLQMQRNFCAICGDVMYATNRLGFKVVPNTVPANTCDGVVPERFVPTAHVYYAFRQIDVDDSLPKYLERPGGPIHVVNEAVVNGALAAADTSPCWGQPALTWGVG